MPGGGLLQLVATNSQNEGLRNIACEYYTYQSQELQHLNIIRNSDMVNIEYLELTFCNPEINNLDDVKKIILTMSIGDSIIQQFPLSLLINLNEPILCDGKMYINLCFDMLFGSLKLIGLQRHEVRFEFKNNDALNCISRYGLVSKLTYLDIDERRDIAMNSHETEIQQISFINIMTDLNDINQSSNVYEITLPFGYFRNISKGFFIECNNVDNLNSLILKFDDTERFQLNRFLVRTKCKKINQNLLYFPFNYDKEYSDRTTSSYEGAANFSILDKVKLKLDFDTPINNIKIYSLSSNFYRQSGGMGSTAYALELCSNTYDLCSNVSSIDKTIVYTGPITKSITDVDASICPILCKPIDIGARYMYCHQCKNNFSGKSIKQWLESRRSVQRTCPLCRIEWSNFEIYINGDTEEENTQEAIMESTLN
jgi:hypothetical protein